MIFLLLLSVFLRGASSSILSEDTPISFSFPSFAKDSCDNKTLICYGAIESSGALSITPGPPPNLPIRKVGRVLYGKPLSLQRSFIDTTITIKISRHQNYTDRAGDGMTFIFASDKNGPSAKGVGEYLGLQSSPGDKFPPLAVELDTCLNKNLNDPDDNHIGIDINGIESNPVNSLLDVDLKSGRAIQVRIYYNPDFGQLSVYAAYSGETLVKVVEKPINLSDIIPTPVYVGFTAATGDFFPLCTYSAIKMALRLAMLKSAGCTAGWTWPFRRWAHATALPLPLDTAISSQIPPPPLVLPEFDRNGDTTNYNNNSEFGFPSYSFAGSMELMAVPKKKVSRHKRGIRNGPKALKPVPVIVRCKSCGRVKLPHFFCCSGERKNHE